MHLFPVWDVCTCTPIKMLRTLYTLMNSANPNSEKKLVITLGSYYFHTLLWKEVSVSMTGEGHM